VNPCAKPPLAITAFDLFIRKLRHRGICPSPLDIATMSGRTPMSQPKTCRFGLLRSSPHLGSRDAIMITNFANALQ
jgi:hypothetical protein